MLEFEMKLRDMQSQLDIFRTVQGELIQTKTSEKLNQGVIHDNSVNSESKINTLTEEVNQSINHI